SVRRRAMVLRTLVSSRRSTSPAGAAAGAAVGAAPARSTSSATILPSGPVPDSAARSIPCSRAIRRASGDAFTRPPFPCAATGSPSLFSHLTIVPDSIPCPSRGSLTSLATRHRPLDRLEHVVGVRDHVLLHHRRERKRRELRPDALDRRVEPVERLLLDDGRDLRAEAHPRHRLVRD